MEYIKSQQPKTFEHSDQQMRHYPDNPNCPHNVADGTCLCVSQGAKYVKSCIENQFPGASQQHEIHEQDAPFHKSANKHSRESAYSIIAEPLEPSIELAYRFAGVWHCIHNTRVMLWLMLKDIAAQCGLVTSLQRAMAVIGLHYIRVSADRKPRREANLESAISDENERARAVVASSEDRDRNTKASMDGTELVQVFENFHQICDAMEAAAQDSAEKLKFVRWRTPVQRALAAFNEGTAVALADIWTQNRSSSIGKFRTFCDEIMSIPASAGLPYATREYLAILPIHYLAEESHFQAKASRMYDEYGVAPGSGSDATTEMVI